MSKKSFKITSVAYLFLLFFCYCSGENLNNENNPTDMGADSRNIDLDTSPRENIKVGVNFPESKIFEAIQIEEKYYTASFIITSDKFVLQIDSIYLENRCKTKNSIYYNVLAKASSNNNQTLVKNTSLIGLVNIYPALFVASGKYVQIWIQIEIGDLRSGDSWCWFIPQGGIKGVVGEQQIISPEIRFGTIIKK